MKWEYFYDHLGDWDGTDILKRVETLTEFGTSSEILEVVGWLPDGKAVRNFLLKASTAGIVFTSSELVELVESLDEETLTRLMRESVKAGKQFSVDQICELAEYLYNPALFIDALKNTSRTLIADDFTRLEGIIEQEDLVRIAKDMGALNYVNASTFLSDRNKPASKKGPGKLAKAMVLLGVAQENSQKRKQFFHVGERVRIRYRGQEGWITDINGDLYMVRFSDGRRSDSFTEDQLEKAYL